MKPSCILHIIASMDPEKGGVSRAVRLIITGLEKHGIHNEVVTLDRPEDNFCSEDTFTSFALGPTKSAWQYSEKLIPWLVKNFQKYDAAILHGLWLYNGFALEKALEITKSRRSSDIGQKNKLLQYFVMPHGMLDPYFQNASTRKLKAIRNWAYWKLIERKTVNNAGGLLFTCEEEMLVAKRSFAPYLPKQEIIVGLGVEEPPAYNSEMKMAFYQKCQGQLNSPYLLFLGRINEKKGIDLLLEAYKKICQETPANFHIPALVIAGPELDSPFGRKIKKMAFDNPNLKNRIFFTGMLSGDAKWGAFYGSDAFLLPSHQENFGIAVVEALACRKPVLISNKVNIWREIIESGGGMVSDDTQTGVVTLIERWEKLTDFQKAQMGLSAKKCFEHYFSVEAFAEKILNAVNRKSN